MIPRTAAAYLALFVCVLVVLDAGAYAFMAREYTSMLSPALGTPEFATGFAAAMRNVLFTILSIDLPLVVAFGVVAYLLARTAIAPLERARERERIFAADAAHELRSPLAAIASVAQAARNGAAPQERAALDDIARTALEASAIVSDLLTLARDPGRGVLQCEPVDLAAIVASSARDSVSAAQARHVCVQSSATSAIVDGDERRLRELARNLLDNAIRHARSTVTIRSSCNGRFCEIVVEDDGEGIPARERERIFERFYRRSEDGSGTGLGLAIVRWIAHAHGGTVTVSEAAAGGARFIVSIPPSKAVSGGTE